MDIKYTIHKVEMLGSGGKMCDMLQFCNAEHIYCALAYINRKLQTLQPSAKNRK